jgi:tripartite-type tricarboxylate transporter receptor subunit TctC
MVRSGKGIFILLTLFIVAMVAAACGADATPTPRPTNTPAPAATATPTLTPGEAPLPTATPRPAATATPVPAWKPTKTVTWIVPYSPGGGFDAYSRGISQLLKEKYLPDGIDIVVKNTPGANGRTGLLNIWRSRPDGHTIGIVDGSGAATFQALKGVDEAGYDLSMIPWLGNPVTEPLMLSANKDSSVMNGADLRARDEITVVAVGNSNILQWVILEEELGVKVNFITGYPGSAEMMIALARGDGEFGLMNVQSQIQFVESGDVRPLIIFGSEKNSKVPTAVTTKEGLGADIIFATTRGIGISPDTSDEVVVYWRGIFAELLVDPDFIAWAERTQRPISPETGEQIDKAMKDQVARADKVKDAALAVFEQLGQ